MFNIIISINQYRKRKKIHMYKISENKIIEIFVANKFRGVIFSCNCTVLRPHAQLPVMSVSRYEFDSFVFLSCFWSSLILQLGGTVRRRNLSNATHALAMIIMRDKDIENTCNTRY